MKLCVLNQKGGTGKTTTAIHLAMSLAKRKRNVLLMDNDPQGSLGVSFQKETTGMSEVLKGLKTCSDVVQTITESLDLLASNHSLYEIEALLHTGADKKTLFSKALEATNYQDYVIDMAPSRSKLNEAALFFADEVLIPVSCDYLALVGVRDILEFIDKLNEEREQPLKLRGILPTMYDPRNKISKETVEILKEHFPDQVFPPIHHTTKIKEAPSFGKTIFEYAPQNRAALDYEWLGNLFGR